jgi:predicted peptidase
MKNPPKIEKLTTPDGRRYTIAIPDSYRGETTYPLVFALHYGGPVTPFYGYDILVSLVEPALRELEAVLVSPDCNAGNWANFQSEQEILDLLDLITGSYNINPNKTLLTGYSIGGIGTWAISARNQDIFKAALPLAAVPPEDVSQFDWQIPVYAIHGRHDELFPLLAVEQAILLLRAQGASIELVVIDGIGHYETHRYAQPLRKAIPWILKSWS